MTILARRGSDTGWRAAALAVFVVACGGPDEDTNSDPSMETGSGGAAGGGGSSGGGPAGGSAGTGGAAEDDAPIGTVQIVRPLSYTTPITRVHARFARVEQAEWEAWDEAQREARGCTTTDYGACRVTRCDEPSTASDPDSSPSSEKLDSGTIEVTTSDGLMATGVPTGENNEYQWTTEGDILGGESLDVSTSGGTVSAFEATLDVPLAPLLTTPSTPMDAEGALPIVVSPSVDLIMAWDRGDSADFAQILIASPSDSLVTMTCEFEAPAGSATIPKEALSELDVGTTIHLFSGTRTSRITPEGEVRVVVGYEMATPNRMAYPYFVIE